MEQCFSNGTEIRFPYHLDEVEWGEIRHVEVECPGVFYLGTQPVDGHLFGREMYAVTPEAIHTIVSDEALRYGVVSGGVYLFEYGVERSGYELICYEIYRYRVKKGIPVEQGTDSLYCAAVYAAEQYPEYFGGLLPPRHTPFGLTVRIKKVAEGLYFLETDRCQWVLAAAYPVWQCDLSPAVQKLGTFCKYDEQTGVQEAKYLFFEESCCAPAIYELLDLKEYQGLSDYITSRTALETEMFSRFPNYTIQHNCMEVTGRGKCDMLANLLVSIGAELPEEYDSEEQQAKRIANCIHLTPETSSRRLLTLPL